MDDKFLIAALKNTDARVAADKSVAPSFLLAVFNWLPLQELAKREDFYSAVDRILKEQQQIMAVPRRFVSMIRDVWEVQQRLERRRSPRQIEGLYELAKFRAAYDFLLLRAQAGDTQAIPSAQWWQKYVEGDDATKTAMTSKLKAPKRRKRKVIT